METFLMHLFHAHLTHGAKNNELLLIKSVWCGIDFKEMATRNRVAVYQVFCEEFAYLMEHHPNRRSHMTGLLVGCWNIGLYKHGERWWAHDIKIGPDEMIRSMLSEMAIMRVKDERCNLIVKLPDAEDRFNVPLDLDILL